MFSVLLKAHEASPTLTLKHAKIGDEGALEIARFLAHNTKLVRLDLTGNGITPIGAAHLAEALRTNSTLESLTLRHNSLGLAGHVIDFSKFCRAVGMHARLEHLDLRNNGIAGTEFASHIGQALKANVLLTHVELSWNPLTPAGGQVLLEHVRQNTTMFDLQLSGCGLAEEMLVTIAQLLKRNRAAKGAKMQAGPYRLKLEDSAAPLPHSSTEAAIDAANRTQEDGLSNIVLHKPTNWAVRSDMVVSASKTRELRERLMEWQLAKRQSGELEGVSDVDNLLTLLDTAQRQHDEERSAQEQVRVHSDCVVRSFQDRALRYQGEVEQLQDALLQFQWERKELLGVHSRRAAELKLNRDAHEQALMDVEKKQRFLMEEEESRRGRLVEVTNSREACARRLAELNDILSAQASENAELKARVDKLREGLILMRDETKQEVVLA